MIEISLWEQLAAFAEEGTLSKAAEKLHTSQPALTRAMKKLEIELGIPLFHRTKNRISPNDTGRLAAFLGRQLLEQDKDLVRRLKAYDRSLRTISLGCCAPVPQMVLAPMINNLYEGMTISTDMKNDCDFPARLLDGTYQLTVTHYPLDKAEFCCRKCGKEQLFLSVPPDSSLAFYPEIRLSDLDGLSVLLFFRIGFWMEMVKEKAPRAHFMLMVQRSSFTELVEHSAYPCFSSSYFINRGEMSARRVNIPIADEESRTSYYLSCLKENGKRFAPLFGQMREDAIS